MPITSNDVLISALLVYAYFPREESIYRDSI